MILKMVSIVDVPIPAFGVVLKYQMPKTWDELVKGERDTESLWWEKKVERVVDWDGVTDDDGKPIPFSKAHLKDAIKGVRGFLEHMRVAFLKIGEAPDPNSLAPSKPSSEDIGAK